MFSEDGYLGCPCGVEGLRALNDKLNAEVVEQVNDTQELVLMNSFAWETDEFQFKKCLQDRISEIASWRWVLKDVIKRLDEGIDTLKYEHKALRVVIQRIKGEIEEFSKEGTRPGALHPHSDTVEEAIRQEFDYLRKQKKYFEDVIPDLEKQTKNLESTKKRIEDDVIGKDQTISIEEACAKMDLDTACRIGCRKKVKKKLSPTRRWEKRCESLKKAGLCALTNAVVTRQQLRGARVALSISAQAYAARVDSALRRRLHANQIKIDELSWQREEAVRDYNALSEELTTTEQRLVENMAQEQLVEGRIADRTQRPAGELTRDDVNRKLKDEVARLRRYTKELRSNITRIISLQNKIAEAISQIDCCGEEIFQVIQLDEDRIRARLGDLPAPRASSSSSKNAFAVPFDANSNCGCNTPLPPPLTCIVPSRSCTSSDSSNTVQSPALSAQSPISSNSRKCKSSVKSNSTPPGQGLASSACRCKFPAPSVLPPPYASIVPTTVPAKVAPNTTSPMTQKKAVASSGTAPTINTPRSQSGTSNQSVVSPPRSFVNSPSQVSSPDNSSYSSLSVNSFIKYPVPPPPPPSLASDKTISPEESLMTAMSGSNDTALKTIKEEDEDEDDDYPFND